MTRHTPDFLRQRSSNMSLRMAAAANASEASQSLYDGFTSRTAKQSESVAMSKAQTAFIMGDLAKRTSYKLCATCQRDLASSVLRYQIEARKCQTAEYQEDCETCNIASAKPEAFTEPFCSFLRENPTIFHAVDYFKGKARDAGFEELSQRDNWADKLKAGGKYFITRNGSTFVGFTIGKSYKPGNGVALIAGHIDAVTAKLKPVSKKPNKAGYIQLGVAPYAGALDAPWWDRDLSIGGRVIVRDPATGKTSAKLVQLDWPIARVPSLAPHFASGWYGSLDKETQAVPIIGLDNSDLYPTADDTPAEPLGGVGAFTATQPPKLVKAIAKQMGVQDYADIVNWELELFDLQPATVGGLDKEFIFAGRLDDKLCSWGAFQALLASDANEEDGHIKMIALFDDEEIGSRLRQSADSNLLPLVIERTVEAFSTSDKPFGPGVMGQTYARSFLVSADVLHAVNPNFVEKYLEDHAPRLNVGIVFAQDPNGNFTTDSVSTTILRRVCELSGCTPQTFQIRNSTPSGGTIGPQVSRMLGVRAADVGMPQLSMHSIRATTGSLDPGLGVKFFKAFYDKWEQVDAEWH